MENLLRGAEKAFGVVDEAAEPRRQVPCVQLLLGELVKSPWVWIGLVEIEVDPAAAETAVDVDTNAVSPVGPRRAWNRSRDSLGLGAQNVGGILQAERTAQELFGPATASVPVRYQFANGVFVCRDALASKRLFLS